jgi:hypothetical protein
VKFLSPGFSPDLPDSAYRDHEKNPPNWPQRWPPPRPAMEPLPLPDQHRTPPPEQMNAGRYRISFHASATKRRPASPPVGSTHRRPAFFRRAPAPPLFLQDAPLKAPALPPGWSPDIRAVGSAHRRPAFFQQAPVPPLFLQDAPAPLCRIPGVTADWVVVRPGSNPPCSLPIQHPGRSPAGPTPRSPPRGFLPSAPQRAD